LDRLGRQRAGDNVMLCLTVRQPWTYAIFYLGKDIENRDWLLPPRIKGQRVAIHAATGMTRKEYDAALLFIRGVTDAPIPAYADLSRRMVLGTVEIIGCVEESTSPWFMGIYGFQLRNPRLLPQGPVPAKGALGFWNWEGVLS
jgi:hypothetical protein